MRNSVRIAVNAAVPGLALMAVLAAGNQASAQANAPELGPRVWEIKFGTPASQMPVDFRLPACGTHGGPPSTQLKSFADFSRCRPEPATGLREVWFTYDDEIEYYMRAMRVDPALVGRYRANQFLDHLVIYSLLFDPQGLLQGYRIITDPREDDNTRVDADAVGVGARAMLPYGGSDWNCKDLPPSNGQQPWGDVYENSVCDKTAKGAYVTVAQHGYLKAGQQATANGATPLPSEFDSGSSIEVINADLVGKLPLK